MHPTRNLSIWFFIGIYLAVSGALITGVGICELFSPPEHPVALFHLHAKIWWGALLLAIGLCYSIRLRPNGSNRRDRNLRRPRGCVAVVAGVISER